jgi:tRNA (guanine37-N1)-methyltransferase
VSAARYCVLTLHPDQVEGPLGTSILGRARRAGLIEVEVADMRPFGEGRHLQVDDTPYGGGAGMVLRVDVVARALAAVRRPNSRVLLMTPSGAPFTQTTARRLAEEPDLVLLCGHYEGFDARVEALVDEEISLGDFVLTGGEIAACAVVDAVARLRPGVLGNEASPMEESFSDGLLEHPHYTRPRTFDGLEVPDVLLSGDHAKIAAFRMEEAIRRTRERRPDLFDSWRLAHPEPVAAPQKRKRRVDGSSSKR